jgi:glutathione peroxidase
MEDSFYRLTARSLQGQDINMGVYKNKVILIVNTASKCGLTPQYEGLEQLYQKYKDRGFVILGFPCNQFSNQEPGSDREIAEGCIVNYGVSFPMFSKIYVNGDNAHPIYKYLKNNLSGLFGSKIRWNFTKFFINAEGVPAKRYSPSTKPEKLVNYIEKLLPEI